MTKKALILEEHLDDSAHDIIVTVDSEDTVLLDSKDPDISFFLYLWKEDLEAMLELLDD